MFKKLFPKSFDDFSILKRLVAENFRDYAWQYAIAMGLMSLVAAATGFSAWMMKDLINKVFIDRDPNMMYLICGSVAAVYIAKGFASYGQEVLLARIANSIIAATQKRIYRAILSRNIDFFQDMGSSDLITRLTFNAQSASGALNLIATSLGRDLFTILSLLYVMLAQDVVLTAIALIGVPVLFGAVARLLKQMRKLFGREVLSMAQIVAGMQDTFHGIRVIRSFRLEDMMLKRMDGAIQSVQRLSNKMSAIQAGTMPLIDTLGGIAVASVIFYGGWQVIYEGATPGEFFAFITALLMLTDPARRLARLHLNLAGSAVGVRMLYELIDQAPDSPDQEDATPLILSKGTITLRDVTFGYRPEDPVLHDANLVIEGGKITALVGVSGSGKSTIFNLCLRFWNPQTGEIRIDGQPLSGITMGSLHESIALVSQDVFLFDGTIAENIRMGRPDASIEEVEAAARAAAAHDFIMAMPQGYETKTGEFGGRLSGGQRQRLSIARAFLKNAPILFLDEPTSALDAESDALIQEALRRLMKGRTTLMIAHRLASIAYADKIYVLENGRVIEEGSHNVLLKRNGKYARLYELQFHV
jgi:ATP-binding cassette subfamily B protein